MTALRLCQTADRPRDGGERPRYTAHRNPPAHIPRDWEDMTLDELWTLFKRERPTPQATVEALTFALRERGVAALTEPKVQSRLVELSDGQLLEVATRLQKLKPEIARPWNGDEIETLIRFREGRS